MGHLVWGDEREGKWGKKANKTYPIPLLVKQSPRLFEDLGVGFLLAHVGDKV